MEEKGKNSIGSVNRALELLDCVLFTGKLSVQDAADQLSINRSSAYRLLETLRQHGYLSKSDTNTWYEPGLKIEMAGSRRINPLVCQFLLHDALRQLSEVISLDVMITQLTDSGMVFVARELSRNILRIDHPTNTCEPLHCTASGKAILAFTAPEHREYLISRINFTRFTDKTICEPEALRENLAKLAELGYATEEEELYRGVSCIAVPIYDHAGWPSYSLGTSLPRKTLDPVAAQAIVSHLRSGASKIRKLMWQYLADPSIYEMKPNDNNYGKGDTY